MRRPVRASPAAVGPESAASPPLRRLGLDHRRLTDVAGEVVKKLLA